MTFLFRFLPFACTRYIEGNETLHFIQLFLPASIMFLLTVYTLKEPLLASPNYGLTELVGVATVVLLHLIWRNALLSIAGGTAIYILF